MVTIHRGYLYIMGNNYTTMWDISDPTNPVLLDQQDYGSNGHRWWKLNTDIFWREYQTPEVNGSGYHFLDMSDMLNLKPWTDPNIPVPIEEDGQLLKWQALETFPVGTNGGNVHDNRTQDPYADPGAYVSIFDTGSIGVNSSLRWRIGNLLFIFGNGLAVLDIGDPTNVVFLDSLSGQFQQYTTTYHIWRNHAVFLNGDNSNEGGNNLVTIDFSDPTDLKYGFGVPFDDSPGRYMFFQDEFGFAGSNKNRSQTQYGNRPSRSLLRLPRRLAPYLPRLPMDSHGTHHHGQRFRRRPWPYLLLRPPRRPRHQRARSRFPPPLCWRYQYARNNRHRFCHRRNPRRTHPQQRYHSSTPRWRRHGRRR